MTTDELAAVVGPAFTILVLLLLGAWAARRALGSRPRGGSGTTVRPRDPEAVVGYSLDPATMSYHMELPAVAPGPNLKRGSGPPNRRRRRRRAG